MGCFFPLEMFSRKTTKPHPLKQSDPWRKPALGWYDKSQNYRTITADQSSARRSSVHVLPSF